MFSDSLTDTLTRNTFYLFTCVWDTRNTPYEDKNLTFGFNSSSMFLYGSPGEMSSLPFLHSPQYANVELQSDIKIGHDHSFQRNILIWQSISAVKYLSLYSDGTHPKLLHATLAYRDCETFNSNVTVDS
jgi:hypothetical protein